MSDGSVAPLAGLRVVEVDDDSDPAGAAATVTALAREADVLFASGPRAAL